MSSAAALRRMSHTDAHWTPTSSQRAIPPTFQATPGTGCQSAQTAMKSALATHTYIDRSSSGGTTRATSARTRARANTL
jgi:hypothetical protein